ncbi:MAG: DUF4157 domain-containing protein [Deltaproteobacteria bacterium]|nr:DUF4157 domain-containing protein [Deltaproteobacteria bacterium]
MEPRFGVDFGHVKLHDDVDSHTLAKRLHARAFTVGHDVFFGANQYDPTNREGQRLLAHELTHTLQQSDGRQPVVRRYPDGLMSSPDDTADAVFDDMAMGVFLEPLVFEERLRRLSTSERKRLHAMLQSNSLALDEDIVQELFAVLENVMSGRVGLTSVQIASRPCEPGDVDPVSLDEWTADLHITDLEVLDGTGESRGKLGSHSPRESIKLFQRALIQWGCESASPARNPLPWFGADGVHGKEFKSAVRQFQRAEGLKIDGGAGPVTVKRMAAELYGINLRREVEAEEEEHRLAEQGEASKTVEAREARVQAFIHRLRTEGKRYRENGSAQYEATVSFLVAQKISGYEPDIITEGLERVSLQEPDFYDHVLFGGMLISALQELGIFGVEFKPPSDAGFLAGFIIEANRLEHESPLSSPTFAGWDKAKVFLGFQAGSIQGAWKGLVENVEAIVALFGAEFWQSLKQVFTEVVPRIIDEPKFRFEIGRGTAEVLHKQLTELNASKPYDYGEKLGILFGMVVLEVAIGFFLTGGATIALKGLKGIELLERFPRLTKLARRIAASGLARGGLAIGGKIREAAGKALSRADDAVRRARKLLPHWADDAAAERVTLTPWSPRQCRGWSLPPTRLPSPVRSTMSNWVRRSSNMPKIRPTRIMNRSSG